MNDSEEFKIFRELSIGHYIRRMAEIDNILNISSPYEMYRITDMPLLREEYNLRIIIEEFDNEYSKY
jgi:hypothetical protein